MKIIANRKTLSIEDDEGMKPSPISELLMDLDDYAPGGPKQYKGIPPEQNNLEQDDLEQEPVKEEVNNYSDTKDKLDNEEALSEDDLNDLLKKGYEKDGSTLKPGYQQSNAPKFASAPKPKESDFPKESQPPKDKRTRSQQPQAPVSMGTPDVLGLGALANMLGRGVKSVVNSASSNMADMSTKKRSNRIAEISINEVERANASTKDALSKVKTGVNSAGESASSEEKAQNINDLNSKIHNLGEKVLKAKEFISNPNVSYEKKEEILNSIKNSSEITDDINNLPEDTKSKISENALKIAKIISEIIAKLFSKKENTNESSGPSM